jgi:spore coat protein H
MARISLVPALRLVLLLTGIGTASLFLFAAESKAPGATSDLLDLSKVWSIHLTFSADQWQAMEPKGGPPAGGPGGMFGMGGRGGPGGRRGPGGPGGFSPAMMIAPAFLKGDRNNDGKLSREEFRALGEEWFRAWDKQKQGKLTEDQLRAGIGASIQPEGGPPGPRPAGGGGPGRGPGMGMQGQDGRNGMSAMMGLEFNYVHATIDFNGVVLKDIGVRYKGNSTYMQSRDSLKRSLKLEFNKYVKGQKIAGVTKLNLHSNVTDAAWMNEPLSYRLFRDGSIPAPRTSYARVYLTVAGKYEKQYVGLYSVVEDIDNNFAQERFSTREGAIFKPSTQSLFSYLGDDWAKYNQIYDPKTELTSKQKQRVIDFAKLVTSGSDAEFAAQLPSYIDVDEFARYLSINVWLVNMDSILAMGQNFYLYLNPSTNKFLILPWDLDLSFGGMGGGTELSIEHPWRGQNRFLDRLFKVDAFKKLYLAHMAEFNQSIFKPERITHQVDETAAVIRPAVSEESESKLANFDKSVAGESTGGRGGFGGRGGPGGRGTPIRAFAAPRAKSVAAQLAGESQGQQDSSGFGGRGPGGPPGMGGPGGFDLANLIAPAFLRAMDENLDGAISREEFQHAFDKWFEAWGGDKGPLTEEQVRAGISRDLVPR